MTAICWLEASRFILHTRLTRGSYIAKFSSNGQLSACWLEARGADCLDWMGLFYQTRLLVETMFQDFCYLLAGSQQLYPTRHTLGNSTAKFSHKCQPFRKTFCGNTTCLPFWYHVRLLAGSQGCRLCEDSKEMLRQSVPHPQFGATFRTDPLQLSR